MADYIRRDIVLKIINTVNDTGGFTGYADYCVLFDEIDTMPAADVQPIKHGRWIGEEVIQCSNCNFTLNGTSYGRIVHKYFSYCPKCGARMDGEQNE